MSLLKLIYRKLKLNYFKKNIFNIFYFMLHKIFLIFINEKNFNLNRHGFKFTVFYKNYKCYNNKPFWLRIFDKTYEKQEIIAIKKYVNSDMRILEVGGSLGLTSVIANSKLKDQKKHIVLEANPNLIENLSFNKSQNNSKFTVVNAPISSSEKNVTFNFNNISLGGSINNKLHKYEELKHGQYNTLKTKTITPKIIEEKYNLQFDCLICDIEGEEYNLLLNLKDYFKSFKLMIVEFHFDLESDQSNFEKLKKMYSKYFQLIEISHNNFVFLNLSYN